MDAPPLSFRGGGRGEGFDEPGETNGSNDDHGLNLPHQVRMAFKTTQGYYSLSQNERLGEGGGN